MTKRKQASVRKEVRKVGRKITFHAYQPSIVPKVEEDKYSTEKYVPYGKDNLYPQHAIALFDNVAPLGASQSVGQQFIAGKGPRFYSEGNKEIKEAKAKFHELLGDVEEEEHLKRVTSDMAYGLPACIAVRRSESLDIVRLDHISSSCVRSGKMEKVKVEGGYEMRVTEYWYSPNWAKHMLNVTDEAYIPKRIPAFDFTGERKDLNSLIVIRDYHPDEPYYGKVFWLGAYRAAQVWKLIDEYNYTQIETGFAPAVIISTVVDGTDKEIDEHDKNVEINFVGSRGKGVMHIPRGSGEEEPFVQVLERGNHAGELDQIREGSAEVIYSAYGVPSLLMKDRNNGLTSQGEAVIMRLQQFDKTWAKPKQRPLGSAYRKVLEMAGVKSYECKFDPLEVYTPAPTENVIMTTRYVDEIRSQDGLGPHPDPKVGKMAPAQVKGGSPQDQQQQDPKPTDKP